MEGIIAGDVLLINQMVAKGATLAGTTADGTPLVMFAAQAVPNFTTFIALPTRTDFTVRDREGRSVVDAILARDGDDWIPFLAHVLKDRKSARSLLGQPDNQGVSAATKIAVRRIYGGRNAFELPLVWQITRALIPHMHRTDSTGVSPLQAAVLSKNNHFVAAHFKPRRLNRKLQH